VHDDLKAKRKWNDVDIDLELKVDKNFTDYQLYEVTNPQNDALIEVMCHDIQNGHAGNKDAG